MNEFKILKDWLTKFSFLTEEDCTLFEPFLKTKHLNAKDYFLTEGNICHEIGFINKGCSRTYYLSEGKDNN